ncbi:MAG: OmpA family protein [Bacteroidota bacterium]
MKKQMMRKMIMAATMVALQLSMAFDSQSQTATQKWALGFHGGLMEPNTSLGNEFLGLKADKNTLSLGISLQHYITPSFDLGIYGVQGRPSQTAISGTYDNDILFLDLRAKYKFNNGIILDEDSRWAPYLQAGAGITRLNIDADGLNGYSINESRGGNDIYGGLGVRYRLSNSFSLNFESGVHFPTEKELDANADNTGTVGTGFLAGKKDKFMVHSLSLVILIGSALDTDKDGVQDKLDKCPGTPSGVGVDRDGCPLDQDRDGVYDYQDDCVRDPGVAELKGCPDRDGDGIGDKEDRCPDQKGIFSLKGCPDTDTDGVADLDDKCKDTKAGYKVDASGCPKDDDKDGLVNEEDECPEEKGTAISRGCPDRDGDGIADKSDKCPDVKGIVANKGCPEVAVGVVNELEKVADNIFFDFGSDRLTPGSKTRLNDLITILSNYKEATLVIEGHTDNVGDATSNMALSQKRCEAVKQYLISKGITANRLLAAGYGDTRPVSDNKTESGRAKNRRVEMRLEY